MLQDFMTKDTGIGITWIIKINHVIGNNGRFKSFANNYISP